MPVLARDEARGPFPCDRLVHAQTAQDFVEKERQAPGVGGVRMAQDPRADPAGRGRLGPRETLGLEGDRGRRAEALPVHVDQGPSGVEENRLNVAHASSARAAASRSSAIDATSFSSSPSTRMRSSASVPE